MRPLKKYALLIIVVSIFNKNYSQTELKFNVISAGFLVPNFGIEIPVTNQVSFQLDVLGSFWDSFNGSPLHITQIIPEFRYYTKPNRTGWLLGAHSGFGMFTLQKPSFNIIYDAYQDPASYSHNNNDYQSGRVAFYGITLGYKKFITNRWGLEAFIGGGLTQSKYKGYSGLTRTDVTPFNYKNFNGSGEVALYRGGLMLIYKLKPI